MSETKGDHDTAAAAHAPTPASPAETPKTQLADLMAEGSKGGKQPDAAKGAPARDLDAEALRAAEQALAEGARALAAARAQLAHEPPKATPRRGREIALRLLLAANVVAMLVVAMIPGAPEKPSAVTPPAPQAQQHETPKAPSGPRFDDKYLQALVAAERRDYRSAIDLLEQYMADSPRMAAGTKLNVLLTLAHYAGLTGNATAEADYRRRANALGGSHTLPEDLVQEAEAALANGDQASLRRIWARFLLQQRQIPSSLYKHVAQAYLELGDSYRKEADVAAEQERLTQLQKTAEALKQKAAEEKK